MRTNNVNSIGYFDSKSIAHYHYIKDHVGNINAVVNSASDTLVQSTIYYASGVPMAQSLGPNVPLLDYTALGVQYTENFGWDVQPYLYNGKEFVEVHGLNEYDSQARWYYAPIMRTTTMDPHAENNYHQSPYSWCSNNPVNRIDPDGMDDEFDKEGVYIRHIDNGTDYVLVENGNGEMQNITEFSYGENDVDNRTMLGNVATYYAHQIGLGQEIGVKDYDVENGFAATDLDTRQVFMAVKDGEISSFANTCSNIMNSLEHEKDHVEKGTRGSMAEVRAIQRQLVHSTWTNTTVAFKQGVVSYLIDNTTRAINNGYYNEVKSLMTPNLGIINQIRSMRFDGNKFIYTRDPYYNMPAIECRPH